MPEKRRSPTDVTEATGYDMESKQEKRFANGHGKTHTRLPRGHLARRDTNASVKETGSGGTR